MHPVKNFGYARPCRIEPQQIDRMLCAASESKLGSDLANDAAEFESMPRAGRADDNLQNDIF